VLFILELSEQAKTTIGKRVTVLDYPDGRLRLDQAPPGRVAAIPGRERKSDVA
jgi:hypothetical protein